MRDYLLLGGFHFERGVRYDYDRARPTVVSSPDPLDEKYPGKFRRIEGPALTTAAPTDGEFMGVPEPVIGRDTPPLREETPADTVVDCGTDVTGEFRDAARYGLKVFRRKGRLAVTDADRPADATVGTYVSRSQVERAVQKAAQTRPAVAG